MSLPPPPSISLRLASSLKFWILQVIISGSNTAYAGLTTGEGVEECSYADYFLAHCCSNADDLMLTIICLLIIAFMLIVAFQEIFFSGIETVVVFNVVCR